MSIASEITRLQNAKSTLKTKLNAKNDEQHQITNETIDEYGDFVDSIQSSNIIGATAEGESLSLANTKAMPYNDYVVKGKSEQEGEPSPSYPSEIHSVADDVNLFDKEKASINSGTIKTVLDTGVRITLSSSGTFRYSGIEIGGAELLGKTITLYSTITQSSNNDGAIFLYYGNSSNMAVSNAYANIKSTGSLTITIANEFPTNCDRIYGLFYANRNGTGNTNDYVDYTNLKIQYGDTATPYSPYNQGTVTIKQRGKNLWNEELENAEYDANGNKEIATIWLVNKNKINVNPNTTYTISQQQTPSQYRIICFNNNTFLEWISSTQDITTGYKNFTFTTPANCNKIYIQFRSIIENINQGSYVMIPSDITNIQLEQGSTSTPYEPYQGNDYTFQTEPLRSLPNGVKDTIEADGIHRRVGRVVLDGSENWSTTGTFTSGIYRPECSALNGIIKAPSSPNISPAILCDYYNAITNNQSYTETEGISISTSGNIRIYDSNYNTDDISLYKTWLSTHNTEVLYELAEEIIEPLTQNQATTMLDIIKTGSYEGTTNIYTDEDVKPTIEVDYYKYGETGGLPTVENEKLIFDKELQIDREELIF